ncbi:MAG: hypothetical protein F4Y24_02155 [Gemmatimonadetes bacterium]|nr:hypothetical protein [Gemmatimonadota bacterium]MYG23591.1 hypothetical protein [Gemmatimonadota bacterium]MYJ39248.1 hypothetical protein [Gemmatimonadota bacterium]
MYERTQAILIAGAWMALAGCGDSESRSDWTTLLDTLASGTVHITNIPAANASPTWTLVEELRVGTLEGTGPDAFAYLKGLVALEGGGFAVLDSQIQELRVFGPDGAHVASHGGKGQGPGEFVDANGLMLGPNGRLWVPDARNGRMSVFDPEDGFIESFPLAGGSYSWVWDGAIVDGSRIYRPWSSGNRYHIRVYDLTMTLVDSLPLPSDNPEDEEFDPDSQSGAFYLELNGGYSMYGIPFFASTVSFIDSRGAVWSTRAGDPAYRMTQREPGGETTFVVETRRPAVPVPEVERDSVIDELRQILSDAGASGEWDLTRVPTVKPAVEAIFESVERNLWVRTPSADGGVLFDVYSGEGSHLGTASLRAGLNLWDQVAPVVRGDSAWLIVTDELDVQYVVRARIAVESTSIG